jgi:hypothetical protein
MLKTLIVVAAVMVFGLAGASSAIAATPVAAPLVVTATYGQSSQNQVYGIYQLTNNTSQPVFVTRRDFELRYDEDVQFQAWLPCGDFGVIEGASKHFWQISGVYPGPELFLAIPPHKSLTVGCWYVSQDNQSGPLSFEVRYDIGGYRGISKGTVS